MRSTLDGAAWSSYLREYPDRCFVDTISQIIQFGANIGFAGDRTISQRCSNLKTAFASPSITESLSADIAMQIAIRRTHSPFTSPPFSNFRASPIGAVARKHSTKVRRIHHFSWPQEKSVNDGIPNAEATINYDMAEHAIRDLIASELGSLMLKLDLEAAFRHIPVQPADWPLLGFEWRGNLYHDVVLAFGARSAPYVFNLFAEAVHWILQWNIPARVHHYLDDFLEIFPRSTSRPIID